MRPILGELVQALIAHPATPADVSALELAEAIWAGSHLAAPVSDPLRNVEPEAPTPDLEAEEEDEEEGEDENIGPSEETEEDQPSSPGAHRREELWAEVLLEQPWKPRERLQLARALHRLARRRMVGKRRLDVARTVHESARADQWTPVFTREVRPTSHLVLLVDQAGQLDPWRTDIRELVHSLEEYPSFASYAVIDLDLSGKTSTSADVGAALRPGLDNLVLIISDGLGSSLIGGTLGTELVRVPSDTLIAWLHPWEQRRWKRGPIGRLTQARPWAADEMSVAITEFSFSGLRALVPFALRRSHRGLQAFVVPQKRASRQGSNAQRPRPPADYKRLAHRFASAAEPPSVFLLGLASAVPGRVDLQLLQSLATTFGSMLGQPCERFHVAEALTSGFLTRAPTNPDNLVVEFVSAQAKTAAQSFVSQALLGQVLEHVYRHFSRERSAAEARSLQIPIRELAEALGESTSHEEATEEMAGLPYLVDSLAQLRPTKGEPRSAARPEPIPTDKSKAQQQDPWVLDTFQRTGAQATRALSLIADEVRLSLRARLEHPERLDHRYSDLREAGLTTQNWTDWLEAELDLIACSWVLAVLTLRILDDRELIHVPAGSPQAEADALGFLQQQLERVSARAGFDQLLGRENNPLWTLDPTEDGARWLLSIFAPPGPIFSDLDRLGNLYQDLSELLRRRDALVQTPPFVREFMLDHSLEPAILDSGHQTLTLIDPACGSGGLLVDAFERLWRRRKGDDTSDSTESCIQQALDCLWGVDLNPFAIAVARLRLLLAAIIAMECRDLEDAPEFKLNLLIGNSLLEGEPIPDAPKLPPYEASQDELAEVFHRRFTVVVSEPPFTTPRNRVLTQAYRERFSTCRGVFSLVVPFVEQAFHLVKAPAQAGWVCLFVANSFMKREFGKELVEAFLTQRDLTHVVDTSSAYIPGHRTPTALLVGRGRAPTSPTVRIAVGLKAGAYAEQGGRAWQSITDLIRAPGKSTEYVSVDDIQRSALASHPWRLEGPAVRHLLERLESSDRRVGDVFGAIGHVVRSGADDVYVLPLHGWKAATLPGSLRAFNLEQEPGDVRPDSLPLLPMISSSQVRNWEIASTTDLALSPRAATSAESILPFQRHFWRYRTILRSRKGVLRQESNWTAYQVDQSSRVAAGCLLFANVATQNHFVLLDSDHLLPRSSLSVMGLQASHQQTLAYLGALNSSVGCFWLQRNAHSKGRTSGPNTHYEFSGKILRKFPLPPTTSEVVHTTQALVDTARELAETDPGRWLGSFLQSAHPTELRDRLLDAKLQHTELRARLVFLQEELDWACYAAYGIVEKLLLGTSIEFRLLPEARTAFWKEESAPDSPLSEAYQQRFRRTQDSPELAVLEARGVKRDWGSIEDDRFDRLAESALQEWLLDQLSTMNLWSDGLLKTTHELAQRLSKDSAWEVVAREYGRWGSNWSGDLPMLVEHLIQDTVVPIAAASVFRPSGLEKQAKWVEVWRRQDAEDREGSEQAIPSPPRFKSSDFKDSRSWRLRGPLNVPKERFFSLDQTLRFGLSGLRVGPSWWPYSLKERACRTHYGRLKQQDRLRHELLPALVAISELIPWCHRESQLEAHPVRPPAFQVDQELQALGLTQRDLREWGPGWLDEEQLIGEATTRSSVVLFKQRYPRVISEAYEEVVLAGDDDWDKHDRLEALGLMLIEHLWLILHSEYVRYRQGHGSAAAVEQLLAKSDTPRGFGVGVQTLVGVWRHLAQAGETRLVARLGPENYRTSIANLVAAWKTLNSMHESLDTITAERLVQKIAEHRAKDDASIPAFLTTLVHLRDEQTHPWDPMNPELTRRLINPYLKAALDEFLLELRPLLEGFRLGRVKGMREVETESGVRPQVQFHVERGRIRDLVSVFDDEHRYSYGQSWLFDADSKPVLRLVSDPLSKF